MHADMWLIVAQWQSDEDEKSSTEGRGTATGDWDWGLATPSPSVELLYRKQTQTHDPVELVADDAASDDDLSSVHSEIVLSPR